MFMFVLWIETATFQSTDNRKSKIPTYTVITVQNIFMSHVCVKSFCFHRLKCELPDQNVIPTA